MAFMLFLASPSSSIAWTWTASIVGRGGWWILAEEPSGGLRSFCTYGWGLGFSFK